MTYSSTFKRKVNATGADEVPRILLQIDNDALVSPIRVVNDTQDLTSNGHLFVALGFDCTLPDQTRGQMPRAQLRIDNVGGDLTEWLDDSRGGKDTTVRIMQVLRSNPDLIEWEVTLDLVDIKVLWGEVSGSLGFENLLNKPAVAVSYTPATAPGLF